MSRTREELEAGLRRLVSQRERYTIALETTEEQLVRAKHEQNLARINYEILAIHRELDALDASPEREGATVPPSFDGDEDDVTRVFSPDNEDGAPVPTAAPGAASRGPTPDAVTYSAGGGGGGGVPPGARSHAPDETAVVTAPGPAGTPLSYVADPPSYGPGAAAHSPSTEVLSDRDQPPGWLPPGGARPTPAPTPELPAPAPVSYPPEPMPAEPEPESPPPQPVAMSTPAPVMPSRPSPTPEPTPAPTFTPPEPAPSFAPAPAPTFAPHDPAPAPTYAPAAPAPTYVAPPPEPAPAPASFEVSRSTPAPGPTPVAAAAGDLEDPFGRAVLADDQGSLDQRIAAFDRAVAVGGGAPEHGRDLSLLVIIGVVAVAVVIGLVLAL